MIDHKDLRTDVYRQAVNHGHAKVRVTHIPSGLTEEREGNWLLSMRAECIQALERRLEHLEADRALAEGRAVELDDQMIDSLPVHTVRVGGHMYNFDIRIEEGPVMQIRMWEPMGSMHSEIGQVDTLKRDSIVQLRDACNEALGE